MRTRNRLAFLAALTLAALTACEDEGEACDGNEKPKCEGNEVLECVTDGDKSVWEVTESCGNDTCVETVDGASCEAK